MGPGRARGGKRTPILARAAASIGACRGVQQFAWRFSHPLRIGPIRPGTGAGCAGPPAARPARESFMASLVTGAAGFLGSRLVDELLARGEPVRALVRRPEQVETLRRRGVEVITGDVRSADDVATAIVGTTAIYHCAAAVGPHFSRHEIYDTNLTGVRNVLEALRRGGT